MSNACIVRAPRPHLAALAAALLSLAPPAQAEGTYHWLPRQNLIVVESTATLGSLHAALPEAPIKLVDRANRVWFLGANILVTSGGSLRLYGNAAGGDVDELRLKSDNTRAPNAFVSITADYGYLDVRSTRITSWDTAIEGPYTEYEVFGRAFIRARSRLRAMLLVPLQSRLDIADSEIQYLGYGANESYGLVWKVVAREPYVFDQVRVYGNVVNSRIHDNYIGLYASGAKNGEWRGNEVYHNVQYGMAPHNRSDDLLIENNDVHHNGNHGVTARQNCDRIVVKNNRVWENGEAGVWLHLGTDDALVAGNRIFDNHDSGIVVYESSRAVLRDNVVRNNLRAGVELVMGTHDTRVERNDIGDNAYYGVFIGRGKGRPSTGDGQPRRNVVADNLLYGSGVQDLHTGDDALNEFDDNTRLVYREDQPPAPSRGVFTNPSRADVASAVLPAPPHPAPPPKAGERAEPPWLSSDALLWAGALALVATLVLVHSGAGRSRH